jgi:hypothetical protein
MTTSFGWRHSSKPSSLLWLGVAYVFNDCIASVQTVSDVELPSTSSKASTASDIGSGTKHVMVEKASLRFFRWERGELVLLK